MAGWTDSHCHIQEHYTGDSASPDSARDVLERAVSAGPALEILERAAAAGVTRVVCIGTDLTTSQQAIALAEIDGLPVDVLATVGLHPHDASTGTRGLREMVEGSRSDRLVGVGECGLDYYYEHSPRDAQLAALRDQVRLAIDADLALVLHVRDAFDDLFDLLETEGVPARTVLHCFTGGPDDARRCLDAGMMVSISGIVTFKNADLLREAVASVPLDHLLVETDSPFLAPVPHRGRPNEPSLVPVVGDAVASLLGVDPDVVREATARNASNVFRSSDPR
jgi:TatD DNase family protein